MILPWGVTPAAKRTQRACRPRDRASKVTDAEPTLLIHRKATSSALDWPGVGGPPGSKSGACTQGSSRNLGVGKGGGPPRCHGGNIRPRWRISVTCWVRGREITGVFAPDWEYGPNRDRRGVTDGTSNLVTSYVVSARKPPLRHEICDEPPHFQRGFGHGTGRTDTTEGCLASNRPEFPTSGHRRPFPSPCAGPGGGEVRRRWPRSGSAASSTSFGLTHAPSHK